MTSGRENVLMDTSCFVALLDRADDGHQRALELTTSLDERRARLLTTDAILIELANYFSRSPLRGEAIAWIAALRANDDWTVVPLAASLIARGEARYRRFADKTWSLTDCLSMEVMLELGVSQAATSDRGFAQAGFSALMV